LEEICGEGDGDNDGVKGETCGVTGGEVEADDGDEGTTTEGDVVEIGVPAIVIGLDAIQRDCG
jgi:hypothetical protein